MRHATTSPGAGTAAQLRLYLSRQADSLPRYALEQTLQALLGWIPTLVGIGLRGLAYRCMLHMDGWAAIERGVRLRFANRLRLGHGALAEADDDREHVAGTEGPRRPEGGLVGRE